MRYLLRRLGFFVLTLWAAVTLNFFLPHFMPGSPVNSLRAATRGKVPDAELEKILASYGFKPHANLFSQYLDYFGKIFTGNFGVSTGGSSLGVPVSKLIGQSLPWTLGLVGITTVLAFIIGSLIGTIAAWRRGGVIDSVLPSVFVVTSALPYFVVGLFLLLFFAIDNTWLPGSFNYDNTIVPGFSPGFVGSVLQHAILPAATLLITSIGGWVLTMRNNMITTLAEDYIRMGRAKGLSDRKVMYNYAARNAFLPNLSGFAMSIGFVLTGAILVERIFSYPGLGYQLYNAVSSIDYPMMQALFLLFTVAVLGAILVCDLLTVVLDPRTRAKG
ncbi:MAG: ABC transporter permease [Catenulispora sp.]|nr:ABC transporter permease [Catenulispora sp.]